MIYGVTPFHYCDDIEELKQKIYTTVIEYPKKSCNDTYDVPEHLIELNKKILEINSFKRTDWNDLFTTFQDIYNSVENNIIYTTIDQNNNNEPLNMYLYDSNYFSINNDN